MLILISFLFLAVICFLISVKIGLDWFAAPGIIFSILFISFLVVVPLNIIITKGEIAKFNAAKSTLEFAREKGNILENAALQQKVMEKNEWLAEAQFYKRSMWGLWVPEEVIKLNPIK